MPRQVALALCSVFILYMLRCDRKENPILSWTLWLPTFWFLAAASSSVDNLFGVSGSRESGGVIDPIFQACVLGFGILAISRSKLNLSLIAHQNVWLIVLIGYTLLSVVWSDMPMRSFRSWFKEIVAITMGLLVFAQPVPQQALASVLRRTVYVLIPFSILFVKYFPDRGVIYSKYTGEIQWIGVTLQKNSLGQLCLISIFVLVWTLIRRYRGRQISASANQTRGEILLLLITFWLLKGPSMWAASATSMVALSVGVLTLFVLLWMEKHRIHLGITTWMVLAVSIITLGAITPFVGGSTVTVFTGALGRDPTLTGRTEIWAGLIPDVMQQPILGYGFSGFWTLNRVLEHVIGEAHCGYLDVCLQLGFVGLFLTIVFLLACVRKGYQMMRIDFDWGCFCLCFVLMTVTESIADSTIDSFEKRMMAVVLFLSLCVPRPKQYQPRMQEMAVSAADR